MITYGIGWLLWVLGVFVGVFLREFLTWMAEQ